MMSHFTAISWAMAASEDHEQYLVTVLYKGNRIGELVPTYLPYSPDEAAPNSDKLLIQATDLLRALGVTVATNQDGSISGAVEPSGLTFSIGPDGQYKIDGRSGAFDNSSYTSDAEGIYLTKDAIAMLVPVKLGFDQGRQTLIVDANGMLPLEIKRARELARARLDELKVAEAAFPLEYPYKLADISAGDVRVDVNRGDDHNFRLGYDAILAGEVAHMTALMFLRGTQRDFFNDLRLKLGRENMQGGLFGVHALTSAFGGDVSISQTALVGGGVGRGILLDAFPIERPDAFDRTSLEGDAPIGWDAELYRNNELLAYSRVGPDGRFRFLDAPLLYSENNFRIKLYGPNGEVREFTRSINVGAGLAPAGKLQWRLFGAQHDVRLFEPLLASKAPQNARGLIFSLSSDFGLTQWLTLNATASRLAENFSPFSKLVRSFGGGLRVALPMAYVEIDAAWQNRNSRSRSGGHALSLSALGNLAGINIAARHARFDNFFSQKAVRGSTPLESYSELRANASIGLGKLPLTINVAGERWSQIDGSVENLFRADARFSIGRIFVTQGVERRIIDRFGRNNSEKWTSLLTSLSANVSNHLRLSAISRFRLGSIGLEQIQISGTQRFDERTTATFGISKANAEGQFPGWEFYLGGSRRVGNIWFNASVNRSTSKGIALGLGANLSFGHSPSGWRFIPSDSANKGRAELRIFHDINNNGFFDGIEDEPVANASVVLDRNRVAGNAANQQGILNIEGLPTGRPVTIDIDPKSIKDPFLRSATGPIVIQPRRGATILVPVPLIDTGTVSGTVHFMISNEPVSIGGVRIDLYRIRSSQMTGERRQSLVPELVGTTLTQPDGAFLFDLLVPGDYRIRVREGQLVAGKVISTPESDISLAADKLEHDDVDLTVFTVSAGDDK